MLQCDEFYISARIEVYFTPDLSIRHLPDC